MKEFTLTAIYEAVCQCHDSSFEEKLQCLSNNNCPKFSDKELITIYFWGKAQQLPTRKAILSPRQTDDAGHISGFTELSGVLPPIKLARTGISGID